MALADNSQPRSHRLSPELRRDLERLREHTSRLLLGKQSAVDAILSALLSKGHVLLEDVPGVGKTTVVKALARMLGLEMKRIQCTSDLLPSDILGVEVYNNQTQQFEFHHGPIFSHVILADELNRTSPRTQSALLEAMGEGAVTVQRMSYRLPDPFVLFATQNPRDHVGTYPLPESQLDRFAIRVHLDYPSPEKEREIFSEALLDPLESVPQGLLDAETFLALRESAEGVHLSEPVVEYAQRVVQATRHAPSLKSGISTRGAIAWIRVGKGRALLQGRDFVTPDDLLETAAFCLVHRVVPASGSDARQVVENLLNTIEVP